MQTTGGGTLAHNLRNLEVNEEGNFIQGFVRFRCVNQVNYSKMMLKVWPKRDENMTNLS